MFSLAVFTWLCRSNHEATASFGEAAQLVCLRKRSLSEHFGAHFPVVRMGLGALVPCLAAPSRSICPSDRSPQPALGRHNGPKPFLGRLKCAHKAKADEIYLLRAG